VGAEPKEESDRYAVKFNQRYLIVETSLPLYAASAQKRFMLYCTLLHSTLLYFTLLYSIILYYCIVCSGPLWKPNPTELVGIWELVDIAGQGSLSPIMTSTGASFAGMIEGVREEKRASERASEGAPV
jgi:hypothetical protein